MPQPVSNLLAADATLAAYLAQLERRVRELERRNVGAGQSVTIGGYVIRASGDQLVATRTLDGESRTIADFNATTA